MTFIFVAIMIHQASRYRTQRAIEPWLLATVLTVIVLLCLAELMPGGSPGKRFWGIRILTNEGYAPLIGRRVCRLLLRSGGTLVVVIALAMQAIGGPAVSDWTRPVISLASLLQLTVMLLDWLWLATVGRTLHDVLTRTLVGDIGTMLQRKRGFEVLAR